MVSIGGRARRAEFTQGKEGNYRGIWGIAQKNAQFWEFYGASKIQLQAQIEAFL